jgi:hypothetical protein
MAGRNWNQAVTLVYKSGYVNRVQGCFAYMFTNLGDVPVTVNDMIVYPTSAPPALGDSRSISGHIEDIYKGSFKVSFESPTAGVNPVLELVQLFYTDKEYQK